MSLHQPAPVFIGARTVDAPAEAVETRGSLQSSQCVGRYQVVGSLRRLIPGYR
jgi:hypothetical protein